MVLGDVLLHVLFYAKIGEEKGDFDIADVADALNSKLIFRHPHVFGKNKTTDTKEILANWEKLKPQTKAYSVLNLATQLTDGRQTNAKQLIKKFAWSQQLLFI